MARTCPSCYRNTRKHGPPVLHCGHFLDQIVVCPNCGWYGVETEYIENPMPVQQILFDETSIPDFDSTQLRETGG